MATVPASSHGGSGLPLTGGTLTGELAVHPVTDVQLIALTANGAQSADIATIENANGAQIFRLDASDDYTFDLTDLNGDFRVLTDGGTFSITAAGGLGFSAASGKTISLSRGVGQVLINDAGVAIKVPTAQTLVVRDHTSNAILTLDDATGTVACANGVRAEGANLSPIGSGPLPTVAPVSGTAFQCDTTRDVFLTVPATYNPGVATTATCKVELSPDNVTFSTLLTVTQPVGTVFDGSIEPVTVLVPAAWYVKLTVVNATLGTGTYY